MNSKDLISLGVPSYIITEALMGIKAGYKAKAFHGIAIKKQIKEVIDCPSAYVENPYFSKFAKALIADQVVPPVKEVPPYKIWGQEGIESGTIQQMDEVMNVPVVVGGALMADSHIGKNICVGAVVATKKELIINAVGCDIACRVKLSIFPIKGNMLDNPHTKFGDQCVKVIDEATCFGVGQQFEYKQNHPVMDKDWNFSKITKQIKDKAWNQLGSSGSGNHFCDFGILNITTNELGIEPGSYVAVMTHSGSRGAGGDVYGHYNDIAISMLPRYYKKYSGYAWLDLETEIGMEAYKAFLLMGDYAAANHDVIHGNVATLLGETPLLVIENHHNFIWKEVHNGEELLVHRKGATPSGIGTLGVIPGSMSDPCFIVKGKGESSSLCSASHGAGRKMSRTKAKQSFGWSEWKSILQNKKVRLISGGIDEVSGCYKNIRRVMQAQSDLVDIVAEFTPRIVKMAQDGKSED